MKPLKVTAHLQQGFSVSNPWSPALDGILAYWHLIGKMGLAQFNNGIANQEQTTVDDMPISKNETGEWYYHCSFPIFTAHRSIITKHHKRFNHDQSKYIKIKSKQLQLTKGIHKNWTWNKELVITDKVEWHIIADKKWLEKMLDNVTNIGGNRKVGSGRVLEWEVVVGDENIAKDFRAIPVANLEQKKEGGIIEWGIRPSTRLPKNRFECFMPKI